MAYPAVQPALVLSQDPAGGPRVVLPTLPNRCPALAWENYQWHPANRSLSTMLGSLYRTLQMHDARRGARMRTSRGARCYLLGHLRPVYAVACSAYVVYWRWESSCRQPGGAHRGTPMRAVSSFIPDWRDDGLVYGGRLWEMHAVWEWDSLEISMVLIESYFRMIRWRFTGFDPNHGLHSSHWLSLIYGGAGGLISISIIVECMGRKYVHHVRLS